MTAGNPPAGETEGSRSRTKTEAYAIYLAARGRLRGNTHYPGIDHCFDWRYLSFPAFHKKNIILSMAAYFEKKNLDGFRH